MVSKFWVFQLSVPLIGIIFLKTHLTNFVHFFFKFFLFDTITDISKNYNFSSRMIKWHVFIITRYYDIR